MYKFNRNLIPNHPGIYQYYDKFGTLIYIGKAKNLRNRVSSYFTSKHENSIKTQFLVKNIYDVKFIIVDNEIEALLLENKLIKKNKPKYNIFLKDSKTYAYIKITNEKIPKILTTRIKKDDGADYIGPFTNGEYRRDLFDLVVKIFGLITNKTFSTKSKLNYEIGLAPAESLDKVNIENYNKNVKLAINFLKGKNTKQIIRRLKNEMNEASKINKFEIALIKKKQIEAIIHLDEKQKVDLIKNYDQDVITQVKDDNKIVIVLFNVKKGVISSKKEFKFDYDENVFEDFIKMYYSSNYVPKEILINYEFEDMNLLEQYLSKLKEIKVILNNPKRGEKKALIELGIKNCHEIINSIDILDEIKLKLGLSKKPKIIECFDMSNLNYDFLVGGMTRWVDLKEDKEGYRKFEIKSFSGKNDDTRAMSEVIYRRYRRLKEENKTIPDLIIIDGGRGHLNAALKSLNKLNLNLNIISIGKGVSRDKNEIYLPNLEESLTFNNDSKMMLTLRKIRDSVHNFVINYNRKKRDMKFKSEMKN